MAVGENCDPLVEAHGTHVKASPSCFVAASGVESLPAHFAEFRLARGSRLATLIPGFDKVN